MNLAEIETFLTIVNTKSITKTADLLFLSQPTVSHRLTSLENELGFSLVIRNKGHKQVELTPKGMDFIILAERWMSLWKETLELQHNQEQLLLNIGCTDSLNIAVFVPLYDKILMNYPHLDLSIQSHHTSELYGISIYPFKSFRCLMPSFISVEEICCFTVLTEIPRWVAIS